VRLIAIALAISAYLAHGLHTDEAITSRPASTAACRSVGENGKVPSVPFVQTRDSQKARVSNLPQSRLVSAVTWENGVNAPPIEVLREGTAVDAVRPSETPPPDVVLFDAPPRSGFFIR
jgi:hypothetical protein